MSDIIESSNNSWQSGVASMEKHYIHYLLSQRRQARKEKIKRFYF